MGIVKLLGLHRGPLSTEAITWNMTCRLGFYAASFTGFQPLPYPKVPPSEVALLLVLSDNTGKHSVLGIEHV